MRYESWISSKYLKAKKGRFLSFLHIVSIGGIAIGVAALIIVLGVMEGFGNNLRDKIIGTTPHIMIEQESGISDYEQTMHVIKPLEHVKAVSPYVQGNVFLDSPGQALALVVRGINPSTENRITKVKQYIQKGNIDSLTDNQIVIGSELARYFGYSIGDQLTLIAPGSGVQGKGWKYPLTIVGIFSSGMADYDMNLVLTSLNQAQQIFNFEQDTVSGLGVSLDDPYAAKTVKESIMKTLGYVFIVKSWIDVNRNLFEALFLEKWGLFIILTMIVLVASFNIISTLIVTVTSKIHDIGILQTLGIPQRSIRNIFTQQGLAIGMLGTFWGLLFGIGISWILKTYVQVPEEIYSIDRVPVDLQLKDIIIITGSSILICFLATIYPSFKAGQLQPVEALRYE